MKQYLVPSCALLLVTGAMAACGGSGSAASRVTVTATVTSAVSATASGPAASPAPSQTPSASASFTSSGIAVVPSGPPVLTGITTTPKKLVLADIFDHLNWSEGLVSVPKHSGTLQALYSHVGCGDRRVLELRFADQAGVLKAELAQALDAQTSSAVLEFKLLADGRLVNTAMVKFSSQGHLETDLTGVSSVRIEVRNALGAQTCQTTAVVSDLSVTPAAS